LADAFREHVGSAVAAEPGVDMTEKFMRALRSGDSPSFLHAINRVAAIAALCCVVIGGTSTTVTIAAAAAPAKAMKEIHEAASRPHVYLMRGLMNVFSLGMDQLAAAIAGHGIEASVSNHAEADAVVTRSPPVTALATTGLLFSLAIRSAPMR
jgi:hypothetical protein